MAKINYYAVRLQNGMTNVFSDWTETQKFIKLCPSNAIYKKFPSLEAANKFLEDLDAFGVHPDDNTGDSFEKVPGQAVAFVDGSYNAQRKLVGWGVVMFPSTNPLDIRTKCGSTDKYVESNNITGELYGAMKAVQMARESGFTSVVIYHDNAGVAAWVSGAFDATTELTQTYANWMRKQRQYISISFQKVRAHTGVKYNEMVDGLAKKGCGIV